MFSRFFINRPIFAATAAIGVVLAGLLTLLIFLLTQPREMVPPMIEVSAVYPGANARVVADTVGAPIEQQVNGVEGMTNMSSQAKDDGNYTLTITFQNGIDLNLAQVLVQNRVALAQPMLPDLVRRHGISVKKKHPEGR